VELDDRTTMDEKVSSIQRLEKVFSFQLVVDPDDDDVEENTLPYRSDEVSNSMHIYPMSIALIHEE
jgi:hypothetical protein